MPRLLAPCIAFSERLNNTLNPFEWYKESQDAFLKFKQSLGSAPALSLPTQDTFQLYVYEKEELALGVITQL
jgi:hypothetical protein